MFISSYLNPYACKEEIIPRRSQFPKQIYSFLSESPFKTLTVIENSVVQKKIKLYNSYSFPFFVRKWKTKKAAKGTTLEMIMWLADQGSRAGVNLNTN